MKYIAMFKTKTGSFIKEVDGKPFKEDNRLFIYKDQLIKSHEWILTDKESGSFICKGKTQKELIENYHRVKDRYDEMYHNEDHLKRIKEFKELEELTEREAKLNEREAEINEHKDNATNGGKWYNLWKKLNILRLI